MMRIIDRYLLRQLLVPFFYCLTMFLMLWVMADLLADNLPDFIQYKSKAREVLIYYGLVLPRTVVLILPLALILSLLYCLSTLSRHNELAAMRASGISLTRLVWPSLAVGLVCGAFVFYLSEEIVPRSLKRAEEFMSWQKTRKHPETHVIRPFFYTNHTQNREWMAETFRPHTATFEHVKVLVRNSKKQPVTYFSADTAVWQQGVWWFFNVVTVEYDDSGQPVVFRKNPVPQQAMESFDETPEQLQRAAELSNTEHMTRAELKRRIEDRLAPPIPTAMRELQMAYYDRYAFPWVCAVVVLLGIPFGISSNRRGALLGVANSLGLLFAYYFFINIDHALGQHGYLSPIVAAWLPNISFGVVGLMLLRRVR